MALTKAVIDSYGRENDNAYVVIDDIMFSRQRKIITFRILFFINKNAKKEGYDPFYIVDYAIDGDDFTSLNIIGKLNDLFKTLYETIKREASDEKLPFVEGSHREYMKSKQREKIRLLSGAIDS